MKGAGVQKTMCLKDYSDLHTENGWPGSKSGGETMSTRFH